MWKIKLLLRKNQNQGKHHSLMDLHSWMGNPQLYHMLTELLSTCNVKLSINRKMYALEGLPSSHKWLQKYFPMVKLLFLKNFIISLWLFDFLIWLKIVLYLQAVCHLIFSLVLRPMNWLPGKCLFINEHEWSFIKVISIG